MNSAGLRSGFFADLFINLFEQVLSDDPLKVRVVHVPSEQVFVLLHAVDEQAFEGLLEYESEVVDGVGRCCLTERFIGDGFLANLVEKKLIGGSEVGAEAVIDEVDEAGKFDGRLRAFARAHGGRPLDLGNLAVRKLDGPVVNLLQPIESEGDLIVEVVLRTCGAAGEFRK